MNAGEGGLFTSPQLTWNKFCCYCRRVWVGGGKLLLRIRRSLWLTCYERGFVSSFLNKLKVFFCCVVYF